MRRLPVVVVAAGALLALAGCENLTDPSGDPVDVVFAPCFGSSELPSWFAVQDGDGSWQNVPATAAGTRYEFTLSSGRGGIAMYSQASGLFVLYATTEEFQDNLPNCTGSVRTVEGQVTGYATADNINVMMGGSNDLISGTETPPADFLIDDVGPGMANLFANRYRTTGGIVGPYEETPNNIFIRRLVSGSTTSLVDFASSTEAGAPLRREVVVSGATASEYLAVISQIVFTGWRAKVAEYSAIDPVSTTGTVLPFYGVPGSRLSGNETHSIAVRAYRTSLQAEEDRFVTSLFVDPTDRTVTLGPALGTVTVAGSSRPSASYTIQSEYGNLFEVVFDQEGQPQKLIDVVATRGYVGSTASSVTLAVPDLSGLAGFSSSWLLVPGVEANWTFVATSADISILNSRALTYQGADRTSTFVP